MASYVEQHVTVLAKPKLQLYRRNLPTTCISFSSDEGKRIFTESLLTGYANIYFPLAEQFRTQDEPAYCGLSTLVMVLNALAVSRPNLYLKVLHACMHAHTHARTHACTRAATHASTHACTHPFVELSDVRENHSKY